MKRLLSLSLFLMTVMLSFAHDFEVKNADGKTIYYNITSSSAPYTVAVTYKGTYYYENEYTGSVTIPEKVTYNGKTYSVTSIGSGAFYKCSGLASVTIPNSVTKIGYDAFKGCSSLTSVNIPNSVTSIGSLAFSDCSGLTKVIVPDIAAWCKITFGNDANPLDYAKHIYSDENTEITDLVIPYGVTTICNSLFLGCSSLTSVTIPNSVTTIGEYAFYGCSGMTSVTIGNKVTEIGLCAFYECTGLTRVTFHCQEIGSWFSGMNIKEVILGEEVTSIGNSAFYKCRGLTSINIPNSVTAIGNSAFYECRGLTSINIPNSVTTIEEWAFSGCTGLTSVTIPNSVTKIGGHAFDECTGLTSITIPNSVTNISDWAFYWCTGLTSVTIPNSVTTIGYGAFSGCSGLTSVTIGTGVTEIGWRAFGGCSSLTSVNIPKSVTGIGDSAFSGCSGLTSITIPNSVTGIGDYAFSWCTSLTSVSIPNSVMSIGHFAFSNCTGLKKFISYIKEPFEKDCWNNVNLSIPLYVPSGTKEKYQSTKFWNEFMDIIEFGGERIEPATGPQEVDMAAVPDQMDMDGMVVGDTYYVLDADNGDGADSENGCVVIITTTNDEAVNGIAGKDISDASVKAAFKGIIFMVPAGTGTISINAETLGTSSLKVKIGSKAAQAFLLAERETVEIPYSVAEPTYVYIYAGTGIQAARSVGAVRAAASENSVKVYSYKWEPADPTGISSVDNSQSATGNEAGDWYTIDGRKLSGKPAQKGIYIVNGRKVAVK